MNTISPLERTFFLLGSLLIFLGILLGAFGAHALKEILDANQLISFKTGVRYQFFGGVFMFVFGFLSTKINGMKFPGYLVFTGVALFSLSIYFLNIRHYIGMDCDCFKPLGVITPIGGLMMIVGWLLVVVRIFQIK